jgi:hypothetical protein
MRAGDALVDLRGVRLTLPAPAPAPAGHVRQQRTRPWRVRTSRVRLRTPRSPLVPGYRPGRAPCIVLQRGFSSDSPPMSCYGRPNPTWSCGASTWYVVSIRKQLHSFFTIYPPAFQLENEIPLLLSGTGPSWSCTEGRVRLRPYRHGRRQAMWYAFDDGAQWLGLLRVHTLVHAQTGNRL